MLNCGPTKFFFLFFFKFLVFCRRAFASEIPLRKSDKRINCFFFLLTHLQGRGCSLLTVRMSTVKKRLHFVGGAISLKKAGSGGGKREEKQPFQFQFCLELKSRLLHVLVSRRTGADCDPTVTGWGLFFLLFSLRRQAVPLGWLDSSPTFTDNRRRMEVVVVLTGCIAVIFARATVSAASGRSKTGWTGRRARLLSENVFWQTFGLHNVSCKEILKPGVLYHQFYGINRSGLWTTDSLN